jgi:hypothetical protein
MGNGVVDMVDFLENMRHRNEKHEKYFEYKHLPGRLRPLVAEIKELLISLNEATPEGPEKTAGVRKLLEAKDCFVRANLDIDQEIGKDGKTVRIKGK